MRRSAVVALVVRSRLGFNRRFAGRLGRRLVGGRLVRGRIARRGRVLHPAAGGPVPEPVEDRVGRGADTAAEATDGADERVGRLVDALLVRAPGLLRVLRERGGVVVLAPRVGAGEDVAVLVRGRP